MGGSDGAVHEMLNAGFSSELGKAFALFFLQLDACLPGVLNCVDAPHTLERSLHRPGIVEIALNDFSAETGCPFRRIALRVPGHRSDLEGLASKGAERCAALLPCRARDEYRSFGCHEVPSGSLVGLAETVAAVGHGEFTIRLRRHLDPVGLAFMGWWRRQTGRAWRDDQRGGRQLGSLVVKLVCNELLRRRKFLTAQQRKVQLPDVL